jgi:hypothetical protein
MKQSIETCFPIAELLSQAGIDAVIHAVTPSNIGGNNRIYRVETSKGIFSAKQYFRHEGDQRDRLSAEYDFLQYAGKVTPSFVPQSYARIREAGWALYENIEGAHICAGQVEWSHVQQAVTFFQALNESISRKAARSLPLASEAVFSVADHLDIVSGRIDCLHEVLSNANDRDRAAIQFLEELQYFWTVLASQTEAAAAEAGGLNKPLDKEQYCISPSDFGFHNALKKANGDIQFIDFEYAGFDDPAKMAGDFFAQLAVPVPAEFYDRFVQLTMQSFPDPHHLIWRAKLLQPIHQVKWCCIAMNVFLPVHMARRKFANLQLDETVFKQVQLNKSKQILKKLKQETR